MEQPKILFDLSYARLQTIVQSNQKLAALKISLEKDQNIYEIVFDNKADYDDWMLKLRKFCVQTNFENKYQVASILEKRGNLYVRKGL